MAFTVIMALLYEAGWHPVGCLFIGLFLPVAVGLFNGLLAEYFKLIPLILTLATTSILIALGQVLTNCNSILMLVDGLFYFATNSIIGIPYPVLVFIAVLLVYW